MAGRQLDSLERARTTLHEQGIGRENFSLLTMDLSRSDEIDRVL